MKVSHVTHYDKYKGQFRTREYQQTPRKGDFIQPDNKTLAPLMVQRVIHSHEANTQTITLYLVSEDGKVPQ
jgi:hypothetical protein